MLLFQGQEPCSGLKNFHASDLFWNSTICPSPSQMCCGQGTLIVQKCISQTNTQHSLLYRGFLMGITGDHSSLGKMGGQKIHILPQFSVPPFLGSFTSFQPFLGLLKTVWFSSYKGPHKRGSCPKPSFSGIKIPLESPSNLKSLLSSSSSPSTIEKSERKGKLLSGVRLFVTPWTVAYRLLCSWNFPGNSPGVDCHFLLQGIFPTQGSNPGLPHCRQMLYCLSQKDSLKPLPNLQCSVWNTV